MTPNQVYRLLAASIESACNQHEGGNLVRAKKICRYDVDDIERLRTPRKILGECSQYDVFHRIVTGSPDRAVKILTGHSRQYWLDLRNRATREGSGSERDDDGLEED